MAVKDRVIKEWVCDVCGQEADGECNSIGYLNGDKLFETSCPLDLCKEHMKDFAYKYSHLEYERGNSNYEDLKSQLLKQFADELLDEIRID